MAIAHYEHFLSRKSQEARADQSRVDIKWNVIGTDDDLAVKAYLNANLPNAYDGLRIDSYQIEYVAIDLWDVIATYIDPSRKKETPLAAGSYQYDFDTTGGTFHITHGYAVAAYVASGGTAPDHKGAINVRNDTAEGVDIIIPQSKRIVRKRVSGGFITEAYIKTIEDLTGKTNNATFGGRAAGEVLFLGATGTQGTEVDPEVTYQFAISPNVTNLVIHNITVTSKKGHEYLWVDYESIDDTAAKAMTQRPKAVYVHRVYESGDFSLLGI